jgi:uncharacterized membrane protein YraQ (UPF0718 family)
VGGIYLSCGVNIAQHPAQLSNQSKVKLYAVVQAQVGVPRKPVTGPSSFCNLFMTRWTLLPSFPLVCALVLATLVGMYAHVSPASDQSFEEFAKHSGVHVVLHAHQAKQTLKQGSPPSLTGTKTHQHCHQASEQVWHTLKTLFVEVLL